MSASKRDELVRKALDVFYRHGFHATGMDLLAAETGISKTSMYKHFRTKDDLIQATLRLRDEEFRNWFARRVEALAGDPAGRLVAAFRVLGEWFRQTDFRSCMFIKASSEFQDPAHSARVTAAEHKRLLLDMFRADARAAGARDPDGLAEQLMMLGEGAIIVAHMLGPGDFAERAEDAARALVAAAVEGG